MAYARRSRSTRRRSGYRSANRRTSYRSRAVRRPARRRAAGRSAGRTIRLEIVTAGAGSVARPEIGMKPASAPRRAMF